MTDAREASLRETEALLARCLAALEAKGREGFESFLATHPDRATELRRRVGGLMKLGLVGAGGAETTGSDDPQESPGRDVTS